MEFESNFRFIGAFLPVNVTTRSNWSQFICFQTSAPFSIIVVFILLLLHFHSNSVMNHCHKIVLTVLIFASYVQMTCFSFDVNNGTLIGTRRTYQGLSRFNLLSKLPEFSFKVVSNSLTHLFNINAILSIDIISEYNVNYFNFLTLCFGISKIYVILSIIYELMLNNNLATGYKTTVL